MKKPEKKTNEGKRITKFFAFFLIFAMTLTVLSSCDPTVEPTESESETETETETVFVPDLPEYEIIDSYWQEVEGYSWRDMYVMLMEITRTSPHLIKETTGMSLFKTRYTRIPLFFTGGHNNDTDQDEYHLYICESSKVYELIVTSKRLLYNPNTDALMIAGDKEYCYYYEPHVLLKVKNEAPLSEYIEIPFVSFTGETWYSTSENLDSFVIDMYHYEETIPTLEDSESTEEWYGQ